MPHAAGDTDASNAVGPDVTHQNPVSTLSQGPSTTQTAETPANSQQNGQIRDNSAPKQPQQSQLGDNPGPDGQASETRTNTLDDRLPRQPLSGTISETKTTAPRIGPSKVVIQSPPLGTQAMGMGAVAGLKKIAEPSSTAVSTLPTQHAAPKINASTSALSTNTLASPSTTVPNIPQHAVTGIQQPSTGTTAMLPPNPTQPLMPSIPSSIPSNITPGVDPQVAAEQVLESQRRPLTDLYGPALVPQDTCLADARKRLETAIGQTRQLREAFTRRVYDKYRVCLKPPPSVETIIKNIREDPVAISKSLDADIGIVNRPAVG